MNKLDVLEKILDKYILAYYNNNCFKCVISKVDRTDD